MIVLFSIAMVCFFALFGMLVILLRQAKTEGAAELQRQLQPRRSQRVSHAGPLSNTHAPFGVSQVGIDLSLSNLVPGKQPDWRFMVRDGGRTSASLATVGRDQSSAPSARKAPQPFHYGISRPDRVYASKDLGDLTDPQSSNIARRA